MRHWIGKLEFFRLLSSPKSYKVLRFDVSLAGGRQNRFVSFQRQYRTIPIKTKKSMKLKISSIHLLWTLLQRN